MTHLVLSLKVQICVCKLGRPSFHHIIHCHMLLKYSLRRRAILTAGQGATLNFSC